MSESIRGYLSGIIVNSQYQRHMDVCEMMEAVKHDDGKARYDLLPMMAVAQLVAVYTHGAEKYGSRNWEKGLSFSRVFAAIMRHCWAYWGGEDLDAESGLPHMAHAACGCLMLVEYLCMKTGEDDRPYNETTTT